MGLPPGMRDRTTFVLLVLLFLASIYRAASLSISMDEAYTYLSFVAPSIHQILTTYSPNHHVLYSLLAKASVLAFGVSELSLRLPALLGSIVCFAAALSLSRALFGSRWIGTLSVVLIVLNPLIFDYMSQARGYGLALGFYLFGILFSVQFLLQPAVHRMLRLAAAGAALGLSLAANLAFGIPVAALNLLFLGAAARSQTVPFRKSATWLLFTELFVFLAIAGGPLMHADRRQFVGGYDSIFETLNNLGISCVLHDWDGNGLWTSQVNAWSLNWLYPAFRVVFLIVLAAVVLLFGRRVWLRLRSRSLRVFDVTPNSLWLFFFGGSLLLVVVLLILAHRFSGAPYPFARIVMYCWPLLVLTMCILIERFRHGALVTRSFAALVLVFCLVMTLQSALQFDLDHFGWLQYSAGTRHAAEFIRGRSAAAGHKVKISASGSLYACLDFYRSMYSMPEWQLDVLSGPVPASDYLVIDVFDAPKGIPEGYRQVWRDPLSKAIVAIPRQSTD